MTEGQNWTEMVAQKNNTHLHSSGADLMWNQTYVICHQICKISGFLLTLTYIYQNQIVPFALQVYMHS